MDTKHMTHEEILRTQGYDICSPISGSMRPMIRTRRDSVLFVRPKGRLKPYDVALYRVNGGKAIMHRVLRVLPDGYYIRGDNSNQGEYVKEEYIFGVMEGFYRDEKYIRADSLLHQLYARIWVRLHPMLPLMRRIYQKMHRIK